MRCQTCGGASPGHGECMDCEHNRIVVKGRRANVLVISETKIPLANTPYIKGCVQRANDGPFLENPYPRDTLDRDVWFNGWLDVDQRIRGRDGGDCACCVVGPADLRIIEMLRP